MKERGLAAFLFIGIVILAIAFYFDSQIVQVVSMARNHALDSFFLGVEAMKVIYIVAFVSLLFVWSKEKRKMLFPLWFTLGISGAITFFLKASIQRLRPFQTGIISLMSILQESKYGLWDFSFPSFHATAVFCMLPILAKSFPKLKHAWIGFAFLIAVSRIYLGLHFLSDVIAGGILGYGIGLMILKAEKENRFFEKIYERMFKVR